MSSIICRPMGHEAIKFPAPQLSFAQPNLPVLIQEIETTLLSPTRRKYADVVAVQLTSTHLPIQWSLITLSFIPNFAF
jgi:hypothetical protein